MPVIASGMPEANASLLRGLHLLHCPIIGRLYCLPNSLELTLVTTTRGVKGLPSFEPWASSCEDLDGPLDGTRPNATNRWNLCSTGPFRGHGHGHQHPKPPKCFVKLKRQAHPKDEHCEMSEKEWKIANPVGAAPHIISGIEKEENEQ